MVKFSDLDQRRQVLIAGNALGMQNIRIAFANYPRVVRSILLTTAGQAQKLTEDELKNLMQQLDEYAESDNAQLFNSFRVRR